MKIIKGRVAAAAACMLSFAASAAMAGEAQEISDAEAIKEINRMIVEANGRGDASVMIELTVDEFLVLAPGGRLENKDQAIAGVGTVKGELELTGEEVVVYGDTALLTGKLAGEAVMEPFGKLPPMKFMSTFVRTDEGWRMMSRALVPCAPVAIERGVC